VCSDDEIAGRCPNPEDEPTELTHPSGKSRVCLPEVAEINLTLKQVSYSHCPQGDYYLSNRGALIANGCVEDFVFKLLEVERSLGTYGFQVGCRAEYFERIQETPTFATCNKTASH